MTQKEIRSCVRQMKKYTKKATRSGAAAKRVLLGAGIITRKGILAKAYR